MLAPLPMFPPNRGRPQQTQGTGSRGCEALNDDKNSPIEITLVTPPGPYRPNRLRAPRFLLAGRTYREPSR